MGIVQLEQERSVTDGPEHGLRAGTEEDQGEYAVARPYLHDVSGFRCVCYPFPFVAWSGLFVC